MNKNRFRLIFNLARGALIAVSELTHSRSRSTGTTSAALPGTAPRGLIAVLRREAVAILMALGMVTLLNQPTFAQIIADPAAPGNQQPMIVPAANGVPLVNIQTPSAAGVSRNVYSQFDVGSAGVILNNASTNTATQLGGWIQGNPYLAGSSARVILNEVNAINPSQLLGYIEVGGSRAQVVIANPAGITCDGCGFINASRATLTTGTPILNGGNLDGYRVQQGQITVRGAGLDARQADYTDLIARAVVVNAGIWAQQLSVTAGVNQVDAAHTLATPLVANGVAPAVSIDVAALGGMYAGKIILVSTEAGVGVRNAGQIGASAGDVHVTADGRLQNSGQITSTGTITSTTAGLTNSGTLHARDNAALTSVTDIDNTGVIAAAAHLALNANSINNQSALLNAGGTLSIQTNTLDNRNTQGVDQGIQANSVLVNANLVNNTLGTMRANNDLTLISSGVLNNTQGLITAGQTLSLADANPTAKTLAITNTLGTLIAGQSLQVDAASMSGDGSLQSSGDISVKLASDFIHSGEILANGNLVFATGGTLTNQAAIQAGNALTVSAANIDNTASGEFSASATTLTATGLLTNRGLIDGSDTRLTADTLNNLGSGQIYGDHLAIAATALNNTPENGTAPVIAARTRLDLGVGTLSNQNGALIFSAGDLVIGGTLDASHQASGTAAQIINNGATIEALGGLTINALDLQNRNANLVTQQIVDPSSFQQSVQPSGSSIAYDIATCSGIGGGQDKNSCAGYPATFEDYTWLKVTATPSHTEVLATQPGQILAGGDLLLAGGSVTNQDSHLLAGGLLDYSGSTLANLATQGQDISTYNGTAQFTHVESCGTFGGSHCREWGGVAAYNPAPTYGTPYNLPTTQLAQHTAPTGSGTVLAATTGPASIGGPAPVALPNNTLFQPSPNPTAAYLIETDPRFASYRTWLSSDYLLGQLGMDPTRMQKRLGDGFYEQRLVREQVAQLTGRRFLDGYANDEAQYQALMNAGLTYVGEWNLIPGVALSAEQVAALTSDIVWLVTTEATLADGTTQSVLSPQVYVRVQPGDLNGSGSLLSGATVNLRLTGDVVNSGSVAGRDLVNLAAQNLHNLGGYIGGRDVALNARQDLNNTGGSIVAVDSLVASAGRDLNVVTTTRDSESEAGQGSFTRTGIERVAGLYVSGPAGVLIASAGRDLTLTAAQIANSGVGGQTLIDAGNTLTLASVTTAAQDNIVWDDKNHLKQGSTMEVGTTIRSQGDLTLQAGNDLGARAAQIDSTAGAIEASAGNNLSLVAGEATQNWSEARQSTKRGFLSSTTKTNLNETRDTAAVAATFSGNTVDLQAGHDARITGSNVVSDAGTRLIAGNDVVIEAATETHAETRYADKLKTGLFTSGASITLGMRQETSKLQGQSSYAAASTVGSTGGDVVIQAEKRVSQVGSDVLAPQGDISIRAQTVDIVAAEARSQSEQTTEFKQAGITLAVSSPVISAIQTVQQMKESSGKTDDPRMQALAAGTAALAAKNAADAVAANPSQAGGASISLSIGASQSQSQAVQTATTAQGSTVAAGGDVDIAARGAGAGSDLTIQGSTVSAGHNVTLAADDEINLLAAKNSADQKSKNSGASASIGISLGSQTGITVSASGSRGKADGSDVNWSNTHVEAGNALSLTSGGDTTVKGAVASGKQVSAAIGGNLTIESLQDTSKYDSKQQSLGGSITVGAGVSGSISASKSKIDSNFASVAEQSGVKAGDGGFNINVKGNTDLKGGVIASTQAAIDQDKNRFQTGGALTASDIQNQASYDAKSAGINIGTSVSLDGKLAPGGTGAGIGKDSGNASSTTKAGISGIAGNKNARTGDAETGIARIFDADKVQKDINAQVQITQKFNELAPKAAADYANSQMSILKKQAEAEADANKRTELLDEARKWAPNGTYNIAMNVIIGAAGGNLGSSVTKETLSWAANEMRQAMIEDSKKFKGICDVQGNCISNMSGQSVGVNGDNTKIAGGRIVLADWCAKGGCEKASEDAPTKSGYKENPDGTVIFAPKDDKGNPVSLGEFVEQHPEWRSPLGGHQGGEGQMELFGLKFNYEKGSFWDKLAEAYSGTHDTFNSVIWYDKLGNGKNLEGTGIELVGKAANNANVLFATPFAASVLLPPELWNAINAASKLK